MTDRHSEDGDQWRPFVIDDWQVAGYRVDEIASPEGHPDVDSGGKVFRQTAVLDDSPEGVYMDDIEAIRRLKARYFRTMDVKDWTGMRQVFTDDVVVDTTEAGGDVVSGADQFMSYLQVMLDGTVTVHQGHMPEIDVTSETEAKGIWALNDIVIWSNGTRLDGYGHYHETYEKQAGEWRIKSSKLTRLHVDFTVPASH